MHIGFDAKRAFLNRTGLGNYSRDVIQALIQFFPENKYFLFTPEKSNNFFPGSSATVIDAPTYLKGNFSFLWRTFFLPSIAKKNKIQIFHGLTSELPLGLERKGIKKVVTVHDLIFLRYPELYNPADSMIYKRKTLHSCTEADKVIAISQQTKDDLIEFLKIPSEKIKVLYQDCHAIFQCEVSTELKNKVKVKYKLPDNFILHVGTIEERKNQLLVLKALAELPENFQAVFVGKPGPYRATLDKFVKAKGLAERVRFLEYIEFAHLPAIYSLAKVFVYPSVFEGFGIPILEALNCKVPVITSEGSCFKETGGDAALFVNPANHLDLAENIEKVYNQNDLSASMIEKGLLHAEKFKKNINIPELMSIYKGLL